MLSPAKPLTLLLLDEPVVLEISRTGLGDIAALYAKADASKPRLGSGDGEGCGAFKFGLDFGSAGSTPLSTKLKTGGDRVAARKLSFAALLSSATSCVFPILVVLAFLLWLLVMVPFRPKGFAVGDFAPTVHVTFDGVLGREPFNVWKAEPVNGETGRLQGAGE